MPNPAFNFEGYELVSLSSIGHKGEKAYWDSYSYRLYLPFSNTDEWYKELKTALSFPKEDILITLRKCFRWGEPTEYMEYWSIVARKFESEPIHFVEVDIGKNNVLLFNSGVKENSVVRLKGLETCEFLKQYFQLNKLPAALKTNY